jgi:hypothetical protein
LPYVQIVQGTEQFGDACLLLRKDDIVSVSNSLSSGNLTPLIA